MKKKTNLVINKEKLVVSAAKGIQRLTLNLLPKLCRLETLEGNQYTVVPMVILLEGVHEGSDGPLYYPEAELSKTPAVWNAKPVVVYHPERNGQGVSACDPDIMNNRKVGIMMNTKYSKGRLTSEAWIDPARANAVDERIMAAISNNEMMELSTGVFVDVESEPGEWNGEAYSGIARNYRPDHLALLPDKTGACSINDGAGFLRNELRKQGAPTKSQMEQAFTKMMTRLGIINNEMSNANIESALRTLLIKKYNPTDQGPWVWIADVYSNFVIYEWDGKLFRLSYTSSDTGEISLGDETPKEVRRVTEYRTVEGSFVGNQDQTDKNATNNIMDKTKVVNEIIATNAGWSETDRPALMAMNEAQLKGIHKGVTPAAAPASTPAQNAQTGNQPAPAAPAPVASQTATNQPAPANAPAANAQPAAPAVLNSNPAPAPVTVEGFIASAPPQIAEVLRNSINVMNQEKQNLIGSITANQNNRFTKEWLETQSIEALRGIAALAVNAAAQSAPSIYMGQFPVDNSASGHKEEAMPLPKMEFAAVK